MCGRRPFHWSFFGFFWKKDTTCLTIPKIYDDIELYEVFVCAWRNWRSAVVGVLAVVIFGKKLVPKERYGTLEAFWHMDTTNCNFSKIGRKIIAIRFCKTWNRILKACIALEPEGDEKWKPRNSINSDQVCLTSTRHFLKIKRKFSSFSNLRFFDSCLFRSM